MLTHSKLTDLAYVLKNDRGTQVALLTKAKGGFRIENVTGAKATDFDYGLRTMAQAKAEIFDFLPEDVRNPAPAPKRLLLKDWITTCAISHSGVYVYTREVKRIWPELRGEQIPAYLIRKHMEACARWPGTGNDFARRWLEQNPELGQYDHAEERRRIEREYGPQPEWTI